MSFTYAMWKADPSQIKFSTGLVLGWLVDDATTETRYALYANGWLLKSEPVDCCGPMRNHFNWTNCKWEPVDDIPDNAVFIGNYEPPVKPR